MVNVTPSATMRNVSMMASIARRSLMNASMNHTVNRITITETATRAATHGPVALMASTVIQVRKP